MHLDVIVMVIHTHQIVQFVLQYIIPIALTVIGLVIIFGARKQKYSDAFGTIGIVVLGLVCIVGAGAFVALAKQIANLAIGG